MNKHSMLFLMNEIFAIMQGSQAYTILQNRDHYPQHISQTMGCPHAPFFSFAQGRPHGNDQDVQYSRPRSIFPEWVFALQFLQSPQIINVSMLPADIVNEVVMIVPYNLDLQFTEGGSKCH